MSYLFVLAPETASTKTGIR